MGKICILNKVVTVDDIHNTMMLSVKDNASFSFNDLDIVSSHVVTSPLYSYPSILERKYLQENKDNSKRKIDCSLLDKRRI
ncbi:hypothetical protein JTF06_06675 [Desemzia sp. RIT804]|uniref:hypothetical protein n=1 Tax=Desemzia sp. RIT 804 TaxID=2810209 RepID=UPI0019518209|nr:hypothetical protein [Desemzia sp. RIT 804]MBM6614572.1 hypothetical protein [Desemzia sp. RIT 804]